MRKARAQTGILNSLSLCGSWKLDVTSDVRAKMLAILLLKNTKITVNVKFTRFLDCEIFSYCFVLDETRKRFLLRTYIYNKLILLIDVILLTLFYKLFSLP